jgi:hypothetical protein
MKDPVPTDGPTLDAAQQAQQPELDQLASRLRADGTASAIDLLIEQLDRKKEYRSLLDALLLKARHDLGLPLVQVGPLSGLAEPARTQFEERYVEAIRRVGTKLLEAGEIPTAWAYFRAIAEPEPVAAALDAYVPGDDSERVGQVIDVAFNQGANVRRGYELILDHYGTCSAITALEQVPPGDLELQRACIERLIRRLHEQLTASVRADIAHRGQPLPPEGTSIAGLVDGRNWLFSDEGYHIDVSHLSSTVRYSVMVTDPAVLALAVDLTEYGRRLSPRLQYEGHPPFERTFEDHRVYLRALLGLDGDAAIAHFRAKLDAADGEDADPALPAQALVNIMVRLGRLDEAIEIASETLAHLPEAALSCPGLAELCQRAGRPDRLAEVARQQGNAVQYLSALLQEAGSPPRS